MYGIRPFGVEAQRLLRLGKRPHHHRPGHRRPDHAHRGCAEWGVKMDKPFFIGQRSLKIIQTRPPRSRWWCLRCRGREGRSMPKECHLVIHDGQIAGRVTSIAYSEAVGRTVGLAFVAPQKRRTAASFNIRVDGGATGGGRGRQAAVLRSGRSAAKGVLHECAIRTQSVARRLSALNPRWRNLSRHGTFRHVNGQRSAPGKQWRLDGCLLPWRALGSKVPASGAVAGKSKASRCRLRITNSWLAAGQAA